MSESKKIIVISGATASGKSDLALNLALESGGEIINADSLQIYKDLPILSAQPSLKDQQKLKHHLYGFLDYDQNFSVFDWLKLVKEKTDEIFAKNKVPIIVGGSGMYISKLIEGISIIPAISPQKKIKAKTDLDTLGLEAIIEKSQITDIKDPQKVLRAYEVWLETGKPILYWHQQSNQKIIDNAQFIHFNLNIDRDQLYQKCHLRFDSMIKEDAIQEVENLLKKLPNNTQLNNLPIARTIGFLEISNYLNQELDFEEMKKIICQKTRNYAKRQLTWFRNQSTQNSPYHTRFNVDNFLEAKNITAQFLSNLIKI